MLEPGTMLKRLYDRFESSAKNHLIADLRVGLTYIALKMDDGKAGIAALLPDKTPGSCTVLKEAGTYAGSSASLALNYLIEGRSVLHRAIGLAAVNALSVPHNDDAEDREATTYFNLKPGEKVAMVGLFAPLIPGIRNTGASLTIIEKNPERMESVTEENRIQALKECDVAIITATTLLNGTFEETANLLEKPRLVALMGPSTPLVPESFQNTPITHLGGAVVADPLRVLQIVSEGGGTPALRPYLRFTNLILN